MQTLPSKVSLACYLPPRPPRRGPCSRPKPFSAEQPLTPFPRFTRAAVTSPFALSKIAPYGGVPSRHQLQTGFLHLRHRCHPRGGDGGRQPNLCRGHSQIGRRHSRSHHTRGGIPRDHDCRPVASCLRWRSSDYSFGVGHKTGLWASS